MNMLELKDVWKRFPLTHAVDIKDKGIAPEYFNDGKSYFWALRNISCAIESGKILGIVGRNGAGKTTLMNIIAGIVTPTEGAVQVNGRVASLFSLGAGFQDELSGKENIFLNASLLGMPDAEIRTYYRSILEFSELNEFIHMPLGNYSQGMKLRLGFSVAIHLNFDILIIDEVLMVGDGAFQKKCFEKLTDFRRAGKTMVITSQTLDVVERLSDEVMVLERGEIVERGDPKTGMDAYKRILSENRELHVYSEDEVYRATKWWAEPEDPWGMREGTREVEILDVLICNRWGLEVDSIKSGERLVVKVKFMVRERVVNPHFGIALFRDDRVYCYGPNTVFDRINLEELAPGSGTFSIVYEAFNMMPGRYFFAIVIWDENEAIPYDYFKCIYSVIVEGINDNRQLVYVPASCDARGVERQTMLKAGDLFDLQTINDQWKKENR
jgi:ABC-type polysaccharide/polyol phosphate transport system ATPase subunit